MRFLWVEDFNDSANDLKEHLIDSFGLDKHDTLTYETLSQAIAFLEEDGSLSQIDGVLLDIRFNETNLIKNEDIYNQYYKEILTYDFYSTHINVSTGILLYILLVFRYGLPVQKIAFISANIGNSSSDELINIQNVIEFVKSAGEKTVNQEMMITYKTALRNLKRQLHTISVDWKWNDFYDIQKKSLSKDVDSILSDLNEIKNHIISHSKTSASTQYLSVQKQFNSIGLSMPQGFEKNKGSETKNDFEKWVKTIEDDTYTGVRSSIQSICYLLRDKLNGCAENNKNFEESVKTSNPIYADFLKLIVDEDKIHEYNEEFFIKYLDSIINLFPLNNLENHNICDVALHTISAIWDNSIATARYNPDKKYARRSGNKDQKKKPSFHHSDNCFAASHAVMKLMRNWSSHQGIKNLEVRDIGLYFLLSIKGIFDMDLLDRDLYQKYQKYEQVILGYFENPNNINYSLDELFRDWKNAVQEINRNALNETTNYVITNVSYLGNTDSKVRKNVSIDDLYLLLYYLLSCRKYGCDEYYQPMKEAICYRALNDWKTKFTKRYKNVLEITGE